MAEASVRFQTTPNPNAGKFTVAGRLVVEGGSRTYADPEAAESPLAAELLGIDGVRSIFMVADFVTVTKADAADWSQLAPRVESALRSHFSG